VVFWLPHLVLEVTLSGYDILLDRAVRFLIIVVVTGGNYNPLGCLSWHLSQGLSIAPPGYCRGPLCYRLGKG
jgi:hypothetical protein